MRFLVLDGKHHEFSVPSEGQPVVQTKTFKRGEVVETDEDLEKFNRPGSKKFRRLDSDVSVATSTPFPAEAGTPEPSAQLHDPEEPQVEDAFTGLTVAELREVAANEEVELGNATRKDDILRLLRQAVGEAGTPSS